MADDYKIQLSIKKGDAMLNVRADNLHEFNALCTEAAQSAFLRQFPELVTTPSVVHQPNLSTMDTEPTPAVTPEEILSGLLEDAVGVVEELASEVESTDPLALARQRAQARKKGAA